MESIEYILESLENNCLDEIDQFPKILEDSIFDLDSDSIGSIIPIIKKLISNVEISLYVIDSIPSMCDIIYSQMPNIFYKFVLNEMLPTFFEVSETNNLEYATSLANAISEIADNYFQDNIDFIKFIEEMARHKKWIIKATAVTVLEFIGGSMNLTKSYKDIVNIIVLLNSDPSDELRKLLPSMIDSYVGKIKNKELSMKLYNIVTLLASDLKASVRLKTTEALYSIAGKMDDESKFIIIEPIIFKLVDDPDKSVRTLAISRMSLLLSTFKERISNELVSKFCSILNEDVYEKSYQVAFSFSVVALSIGKERFNNELLPAFRNAIQSSDQRIRRTLSFAFVSLLNLLDPKDIKDLSLSLLNDLPFVSIGIMTNLCEILSHLDEYDSYIPYLVNPSKYCNWRMRLQVSKELRKCKQYFSNEILIKSAYELLDDEIAKIREDATISFTKLMTEDDIHYIKDLVESENHWLRLCAAIIMKNMDHKFIPLTKDLISKLCSDPVYSVQNNAKMIL